MSLLPTKGHRNTVITLVLAFLVVLSGALWSGLGWDNFEWVAGTLAVLSLASALRAWSEHKYVIDEVLLEQEKP